MATFSRVGQPIVKSARSGGTWCSALNCTNSRSKRPYLSFFKFPTDPERCKRWVINSRRHDLDYKSPQQLRGYVLCAEHFELTQFMNAIEKQRLIHNAVPTLFESLTNSTDGHWQYNGKRAIKVSAFKPRKGKWKTTGQENSFPSSNKCSDKESEKDVKLCPSRETKPVRTIRRRSIRSTTMDSVSTLSPCRGGKYCCAINCTSNSKLSVDKRTGARVKLHSFPDPFKDTERCKQWIINIGRADLDFTDVKSKRVCSVHFPVNAYSCPIDIAYSRLLPSAVPTIIDCPDPQSPLTSEGPSPRGKSSSGEETPTQLNVDAMENLHQANTSMEHSGESDSSQPPDDDQKPRETPQKRGKKRGRKDDVFDYLCMREENKARERKEEKELRQQEMEHMRDHNKAVTEMLIQYNKIITECKLTVDVILPAAGSSERMKLPVAKQYLKVLGKHIIAYTVDCFRRFSWVRHIVVVVNPGQLEFARQLLDSYGFNQVKLCVGSETRHRSIHSGIRALHSDVVKTHAESELLLFYQGHEKLAGGLERPSRIIVECTESDVVIIHDAARPFVPEQVALQVAEAAKKHGAAGVTRNLVSTVISGDEDGKLVESLDRRLYRNSEMPQAFHYGIIARAYQKCTQSDLDFGTECLLLAMKYSQCRAFLVPGTDDLWKVTYKKDIYSMESTVKEKFTVASIINRCEQQPTAVQGLQQKLELMQLRMVNMEDDPANTFVVFVPKCLSVAELQSVISKISGNYNKLSHSAVDLDLLVIFVFLGGSPDQTDAGYSQSVWQDTSNEVSFTQHRPNSVGSQRPTKLQQNSAAVPNSTKLGGKDRVQIKTEPQTTEYDESTSSGSSSPTLHGNAENVNNSAVSNMPESRTQSVEKSTGQQTHEIDLMFFKQEPDESPSRSAVLVSDIIYDHRSMDNWYALLRSLKRQLQREIGDKSVAAAVGVQCGIESPVGEHLADVIWQRSTELDGQVLRFE